MSRFSPRLSEVRLIPLVIGYDPPAAESIFSESQIFQTAPFNSAKQSPQDIPHHKKPTTQHRSTHLQHFSRLGCTEVCYHYLCNRSPPPSHVPSPMQSKNDLHQDCGVRDGCLFVFLLRNSCDIRYRRRRAEEAHGEGQNKPSEERRRRQKHERRPGRQ